MAQSMGIGRLGDPNVTFKRKFRWLFSVRTLCTGIVVPPQFVKTSARPNFDVEEVELNFLNDKTWIAGKATWQSITVTYIDAAVVEAIPLYNWIASVYNFADPVNRFQGSSISEYGSVGTLGLYDGCGNLIEQWTLSNMWPQAVNFGELDYSSSEEVTVELTLRYSKVQYQSFCPTFSPTTCCLPCNPQALISQVGATAA